MAAYTYGARTDRGDRKQENQDSILCMMGNALLNDADAALFLVADGMGGLAWGGQVSRFIAGRFEKWWQEDFPAMMKAGRNSDGDIRELLEQEIWDINQEILQFRSRMQCRCGSTLSLLLLYQGRYYIENMGDSRVYRCRQGSLRRLTEDQSLVAQLVREGKMTQAEAAQSGQKNILTMCLGMFDVPQSFFAAGEVCGNDLFLLCSDGLYNPASAEEMERIMMAAGDPAQKKADLLRAAVRPGEGRDNISVIVVQVGPY